MTKITKRVFGALENGEEIFLYTLQNGDTYANILNYGAVIQSLVVYDKDGNLTDVALGYDDLESYLKNGGCLGAVCGRFANRIEKGELTVDGVSYDLYKNDRGNHLHGGKIGFNKRVWTAEVLTDKDGNEELSLSLFSPDGDENYPGNLKVQVIYSFDGEGLTIDYLALSDKRTAINLTNHVYFNLTGAGTGSALDHALWIDAPYYLPTDGNMIPHGEIKGVKGTPFDFTTGQTVGAGDAYLATDADLQKGKGFDHCFVFEKGRDRGRPFAILYSEKTGIEMQCFTTQPAVQLYAGNFLNFTGKNGKHYGRCNGLCLETQAIPNNVNVPAYADFGSSIYNAGEVYHFITRYAFGVRK